MKNVCAKALLSILASSMVAPAANADLSSNLVADPGFESGFTGWYRPASVTLVEGGSASGVYAARITGSKSHFRQEVMNRLTVGPSYRLSVMARAETLKSKTVVGIKFLDASGAKIQDNLLSVNSASYEKYQFEFQVPANAARAQLYASKSVADNSVSEIDDFKIILSDRVAKLRFTPPRLESPTTITLGTGYTSNTLRTDRDYIVKLPATKKIGATNLRGGRNVVIMGGHITIPKSAEALGDGAQRAIYIKDNVGTVHIEGVLIDSSGAPEDYGVGGEADAIAISAPNSIVQVVNVRVNEVRGTHSKTATTNGFHGDIIQPFGGVKELRVDKFTGSSNYQGFQIVPDVGVVGGFLGSRINLESLGAQNKQNGGQLLWIAGVGNCARTLPGVIESFYIKYRIEKGLGGSVWPQTNNAQCPSVKNADGSAVNFSNNFLPFEGEVTGGVPIGGDYVPEGVAGIGYQSPGYASEE